MIPSPTMQRSNAPKTLAKVRARSGARVGVVAASLMAGFVFGFLVAYLISPFAMGERIANALRPEISVPSSADAPSEASAAVLNVLIDRHVNGLPEYFHD